MNQPKWTYLGDYDVAWGVIKDPWLALADALTYGIKPRLAEERVVAETVCLLDGPDGIRIGRAFLSVLEDGGFSVRKGMWESFKEAIKGLPKTERDELRRLYHGRFQDLQLRESGTVQSRMAASSQGEGAGQATSYLG